MNVARVRQEIARRPSSTSTTWRVIPPLEGGVTALIALETH